MNIAEIHSMGKEFLKNTTRENIGERVEILNESVIRCRSVYGDAATLEVICLLGRAFQVPYLSDPELEYRGDVIHNFLFNYKKELTLVAEKRNKAFELIKSGLKNATPTFTNNKPKKL